MKILELLISLTLVGFALTLVGFLFNIVFVAVWMLIAGVGWVFGRIVEGLRKLAWVSDRPIEVIELPPQSASGGWLPPQVQRLISHTEEDKLG
jgi:hypothetical protein